MAERLTPDKRRELTRIALLEAAAEVFARKGFHGASLDDVAEAAGFSKGAIYSNFEGKEDLFFATIEHRDRSVLTSMEDVVADSGELDAILGRVAEALATVMYRDREWLMLEAEVWLYAQRSEEAQQRLADHSQAHLDRVAEFVDRARGAAGITVKMPSRELTALMIASTNGIMQLQYADPAGQHDRLFGRLLELLSSAIEVG